MRPAGLPYAGGKASTELDYNANIVRQLPYRTWYVEPFAGMLGVLLARRPSPVEIVGDQDDWLVNWWLMVRDYPRQMTKHLAGMPRSRAYHRVAYDRLAAIPVPMLQVRSRRERLQAAKDWQTLMLMAFRQKPAALEPSNYSPKHDVHFPVMAARLKLAAERVRRVAFENLDGVFTLRKFAGDSRAVIYCDPPYKDYSLKMYRADVDRDDMLEAVTASRVRARIAISGYEGCWPELTDDAGWHVTPVKSKSNLATANQKRTERLWTNYPPQPHCGQVKLKLD